MNHTDTLIQNIIQEQIQANPGYFGKDRQNYNEDGERETERYESLLNSWGEPVGGRESSEDSNVKYFIEEIQEYLDDDESPLVDGCGFVSEHISHVDLIECWYRCYEEPEWDNYRCEVLTDPTDSFVVLMTFIQD